MDKYPKHIIDYAIDNKVSLEEAYNHYILNGKQEKQRDEEELEPEINIKDEEQFLSELEQKIKDQLSEGAEGDFTWWDHWYKKMDKIGELEEELNIQKRDSEEITKAEMDWVERQLREVEELIKTGQL